MMIRYVKYNEIDKNKWDACIENAVNRNIYAYSWYLDTMCEKWEALVEGNYERVFPLTAGCKYGINYLYQPFFTQQLGLFSIHPVSEDIVNRFIDAIPAKYKFIEINLNTANTTNRGDFSVKRGINVELNLNNTYEAIYNEYSVNTKRNMKMAIKNNIRIEKNTPPEKIITLFRNNRGKLFSQLKNKHYQSLKNLIYLCIEKGKGQSWGAYTRENNLCAGSFFLESDNKVIMLFLATNPEAKSIGAASFLIDSHIRENSGKNMVLDFEGSDDPGLARFYKSFGSEERIYTHIRKNNLPWFIRWLKG